MPAKTTWSATAKTVDELMTQVISHVKKEHKEIELNAENISKIKSLIKESR
jgi:predicted small metal-binding protein